MRDNLEHTIQSPLCQNRRMYTHKKMHKEKKRRKHTNILPVTVSEWTGWQMIFIFFLRILLDFLNCYNDFPNQTTNKTKQSYTFFSRPMAMSVYKVLSWASSSMMALESEGQSQTNHCTSPSRPSKGLLGIQTIKGTAGYLAPMRSPCSKSNAK